MSWNRIRSARWFGWVRDLALLALLVLGVRAYQQRDLPRGPAPGLEAETIDGEAVSLAAFRGKPMVLHFWATWCGVCRAERGTIEAIARDLPLLSVASQSGSAEEVARFVRENQVTFATVPDQAGTLAKRFGVGAYPTTFVIDADGSIRHAEVGYTTELGLRLRYRLASLW